MTLAARALLITDGYDATTAARVAAAARAFGEAGVPILVQLRAKTLSIRALLEAARALAPLAPLVVNDRVDVALAAGVGVHLPARGLPVAVARDLLGPRALIGVSAHTPAEAAAASGADYVVLGPIWTPHSDAGPHKAPPLGLAALRGVARALTIPVFAVGGVTRERLRDVLAAGALPATIAAILGAPDVAAAAAGFARDCGAAMS